MDPVNRLIGGRIGFRQTSGWRSKIEPSVRRFVD
jgi:hypothetical protein